MVPTNRARLTEWQRDLLVYNRIGMETLVEGRPPRRLGGAIVVSLAGHVLLAVIVALFWKLPAPTITGRPGEALMVDLNNPAEPAPLGNPAAREPAPPGPRASGPVAPPRVPSPPRAPRERKAAVPPSASVARAAPEKPAPAPRKPASAPAPAPEEKVVREPRKEPPVEKAPEPVAKATEPQDPTAAPASESSQAAIASRAPEARPSTRDDAPAASDARPATTGEAGGTTGGRRALPDIRTALRGGGGGGLGPPGSSRGRLGGRGGIEGEPIPLDSPDSRYNDYLERIRRLIKKNWGYPCVKNTATHECEYRSASLVIEFGILKDGRLQFIDVRAASGASIYDDYALNAIRLSSPFPEVPPSMMVAMRPGSSGIAILARFNYVLESSLTNILR
jgi:outer membrane biosynthesis protein TonB